MDSSSCLFNTALQRIIVRQFSLHFVTHTLIVNVKRNCISVTSNILVVITIFIIIVKYFVILWKDEGLT